MDWESDQGVILALLAIICICIIILASFYTTSISSDVGEQAHSKPKTKSQTPPRSVASSASSEASDIDEMQRMQERLDALEEQQKKAMEKCATYSSTVSAPSPASAPNKSSTMYMTITTAPSTAPSDDATMMGFHTRPKGPFASSQPSPPPARPAIGLKPKVKPLKYDKLPTLDI
jgi:hypothetical protein